MAKVTVYSSGVITFEGDTSYEAVLEAGSNNSITVLEGGVVAETSMGAGTLVLAESGAIVSGININDESAVLSGTDVICTGASKWYGAAACATFGSVSLTGGTFSNNSAVTEYGYAGQGGALEGYEASIRINGGTYTSNSATGGGGAILAIGGATEIVDAVFTGNEATYGGALEVSQDGTATVTGATFLENTADYGGAVEIHQGASARIENATFTGNSATSGGAVMVDTYADKKSYLTLVGANFNGNLADEGAAILNDGVLVVSGGEYIGNIADDGKGGVLCNTGSATLEGVQLTKNVATYGGGVWQGDKELTLTGNNFLANTAIYGGGIYAAGSGTTVISGDVFQGDQACYDADYDLGGMGGGIYVAAPATVTVTDTLFEGCLAEVNPANEWDGGCGGAVINYGNFSVTGGAFNLNSAYYGAGLYNQAGAGTPMTVTNVDFTNNSATYGGGAICNCYGELVVSGGAFTNNTVETSDGGAIANWSVAAVTGATFTGNAAQYGGAISNSYAQSITVTGATFTNNSAVYFGGAFCQLNGGTAVFVDCTFSGNTATLGGAINNDATLTVAGCLFETSTDTVQNAGTITVTGATTFNATVDNGLAGVFTVALSEAGAPALVNGWDFITGGKVGIDVGTYAAAGEYSVGTGALTWSGDISLSIGGEASGFAFTVADGSVTSGAIEIGERTYTLAADAGALQLTVTGDAPVPPEPPVTTVGCDDLNGDGRADIVMSITQMGHGAVGATGAWMIQENQTAVWGDLSQREEGWEIFGMGFATAGKTTNDVYVKRFDNIVGAWTTDATGKVDGWKTVESFDADTQVLGLGDFNADGQSDLLLRNVNGAVGCYFTSGDKTGWNYFQSLGDEWTVTAVGDLNGDGRDDVVLKHDAGFAGSWLTQADYTMAWANLDTLPEGFSIVGTGDFNGDGVDDVLLQKGSYCGAWLVQDGNAKQWMGLGELNEGVTIEQIADFDADGKDDLRIRTAAGDLGALLVKGEDNLEWKYYGSVGDEWSTTLASI